MSLKNFVKQNLVLVMGMTLPLVLIMLFFIASVLPKSMSTPPQYEMLFTTNKYESQPPEYIYNVVVKDAQLFIKVRKNDQPNKAYQSTRLMAFDGRTQSVREISIDIDSATDGASVLLPSTQGWKIDTTKTAPDGYVLEAPRYSGGSLLGGLFGTGYRNGEYRLKKDGVGYRIPNEQSGYHYYGQLEFVGWVLSQ
ncbi:MAG: hypothetical protein U1E13_03635 [Methylophilaceae bacterium]|nr:hypothetical protein [Methylophilaceae bacterium]